MSVRLHSLKTPAIVVASLVAAYLLFGWLALPLILDSQAKQYIAGTGHRQDAMKIGQDAGRELKHRAGPGFFD